jgi:hypothetical protein
VHEFQVWEEGVGHVLVEEGGGVYEVECHSVWSVSDYKLAIVYLSTYFQLHITA